MATSSQPPSTSSSPATVQERRGIPAAPFVEDVQAFLNQSGHDVNSAPASLEERLQQYKAVEMKLLAQKRDLQELVPRRIFSLSKERESLASDTKSFGFGLSGEHGPKPAEVYGFVGSITTIVATVIFFVWAYIPDAYLHSVGIFYYPNRYWALAMPTYLLVTIAVGIGFYVGLNFMATPPPTSTNMIFDEYNREPDNFKPRRLVEDQPIEPIFDIGIDRMNDLMFRRDDE